MTALPVDDERSDHAVERPATLMLVSASATEQLRRAAAVGERPCPEFLRLESSYGVQLLDWTAIGRDSGHRSPARSARHVAAALRRLDDIDVAFSDGEHVGIPLAMAMRLTGRKVAHLVIGHHLATPAKVRWFRSAKVHRSIDRILVHSANQVDLLTKDLGIPSSLLRVVPYAIDDHFWCPQPVEEELDLAMSTGREHRDYSCLVSACPPGVRLFVADGSFHSPNAIRQEPRAWTSNVERRGVSFIELRHMYARAAVVVVPLLATSYPFGVTAVLEAMAMGKALIATDTPGLRGLLEHEANCIVVPPGDDRAMRRAMEHLLTDHDERRRLGRAARATAFERYGLDRYVAELARHIREIAPMNEQVSR
jgi:hypothetical protein